MDISDFETRSHYNAIRRDVDRYGVTNHALDITTRGFTVIPPSKLRISDDWIERLRNGAIRAGERGHGGSASIQASWSAKGHDFAPEDDVFEQAARNPVGLALIKMSLGEGAFRINDRLIIRGAPDSDDADSPTPGDYFPLRNDVHGIALGLDRECCMLKTAWLCTDYTEHDNGPIIVVPDSIRLGRATLPREWDPLQSPHPIVHLTGRVGSLVIWHGGMLHGTARRTKTGLHVMLLQDWFCSYAATATAGCMDSAIEPTWSTVLG